MGKNLITTRRVVIIGMLTALIVVLGISGLGIIQIPGLPFRATILHIPVIIGAVLEGPIVGAAIGLLFGAWSIIDKIIRPTPTGFVFFNPLVSLLPRIFIGIVAYYAYTLFKKRMPEAIALGFASILATLTNTVGVLGMIYIVYARQYMEIINRAKEAALPFFAGVAVSNGVPEAIASAILVPIIVLGVRQIRRNK
ncbi:MAG: Pantothenic acid transporter PanT [Firmicutes bacterium ADurb.Bin193]|nr:MAG: Pantothenic acid transporter PanT [Firmicutes bacterium ADurb.Bin193]